MASFRTLESLPADTAGAAQNGPAVAEALRAAHLRLGEMATAYGEAEPSWLGRALIYQVRLALAQLRHHIENPAESEGRISWDSPFIELTYPVDWDFDGRLYPPPGGIILGSFSTEDMVDGAVPEDKIAEALVNRRQLQALSGLTRRLVEWRAAGETEDTATHLLPPGARNLD